MLYKKLFLIISFSTTLLCAYKPAILMEVNIDKSNPSYVGLGEKAIKSFENLYKIKVPIFSSQEYKYNKEKLITKTAKEGYNPIIALGFLYSKPIEKIAKQFPNKTFVVIDGNAHDAKNILNINFKEEEGSFLVGSIAAMKTKSNVIGFVGGMDIPVIRRFACGFIQGIKYINPNIKILLKMTGDDYKAFNNPIKGKKIALDMISQKADVIFHASDRTGRGVIKAAKENKIFAIGVDSNQNSQAPGCVLTSMVKRIDVAIYRVLLDSMNNQLDTKDRRLGLKEEGVSWALDKYNINLIDNKLQNKIDNIEFDIIQDIIKIEDYIQNNKCSAYNFNR